MGLQSIGHNWATKHNQPVMNLGPTKVISIIIILIFNSYFYTRDWITKLLLVVTLGQSSVQFSSVTQSWRLFETPWAAAHQASLSITNSQSLLKLTSIESVMPSNHLILCHPLLLPSIFPSIRVFSKSQFFESGGQNIGVSASASVFPINIQDWFPLGWTGWLSLQSKGLKSLP